MSRNEPSKVVATQPTPEQTDPSQTPTATPSVASPCNIDSAITDLNLAIKADPQNPAPYYKRGVACLAYSKHSKQPIDDLTQVIGDFTKVIELNSCDTTDLTGCVDTFHQRGIAYLKRGLSGDNDAAIANFTEAIARYATPYDDHYWRGITFYHLNQFDRAMDDFNQVINLLNPSSGDYTDSYCFRSVIFTRQGAVQAASDQQATYQRLAGTNTDCTQLVKQKVEQTLGR